MVTLDPYEKTMLFGTRQHMQQIICPRIDAPIGGIGWSAQAQYLDGRSFVRTSTTSHREYSFSWNTKPAEQLQSIFDYAAGQYGDGPLYFIDPFSSGPGGNVLPEWWAAPGMATKDAPILFGDTRPQKITNTDFSRHYPSDGAAYVVTNDIDAQRQKLWVPIPPGTTLWIGAHGPANSGAAVRVTPFTDATTAATPTDLTNIGVDSIVRCNANFRDDQGYVGVEISLAGSGTVQLFGIIAQILPTIPATNPDPGGIHPTYGEDAYGEGTYGSVVIPPPDITTHRYPGDFIGGMGHSGVAFKDKPTRQGLATRFGISSSATLVEIGGDYQ